MKLTDLLKKGDRLLLLFILTVAFFLRLYKLGLESFWLDELFTANQGDPSWPLTKLFHVLKESDQHPPLFYLLERAVFSIFGRSEWIARFIPAVAGTCGVWAVYLFGKELAG